ncbi:MAG: hypothetical protein MUE68_12730 [Bacteroidetes bacterium]|jgi:hypothetical protein|nr:hypothetical protein [Bacteroidota bacterium]
MNPETLWLNLTNAALGLVTVICIVAVVRVALQEWLWRTTEQAKLALPDDTHAFDIAGLGITMADGGERLDESKRILRRSDGQDDDPPNIIRSTN